MQSQPIAKRRREIVSTDLFNVKKDVYPVVVDNLTKYLDVEQVNDTDAESTILQMKKIFARQGVPVVMISDNGPQYACKEFKGVFKELELSLLYLFTPPSKRKRYSGSCTQTSYEDTQDESPPLDGYFGTKEYT